MASPPPPPPPSLYHSKWLHPACLASCPNLLEFFEPNVNKETEIDFNQFLYMTLKPGGGVDDYEAVPTELLQGIVRTPEVPWDDKMHDMVMIGEEGYVGPAFLPYFGDVLGKIKLPNVFRRLEHGNNEYDGVSKVVPKIFKKVVDPKPQLKFEGSIYPLGCSPIDIKMGHYTDALIIFRFTMPISEIDMVVTRGYEKKPHVGVVRFVGLRITPSNEDGEHQLSSGWSLVVWNVRHAGRPSLKENFSKIIQVHNLVAILMTETRVYKPGFMRVDDKLDIDMGWGMDEGIGVGGGSALMWDNSRAKGKCLVGGADEMDIRMLATLKPLGAEDDPSSPEDLPCCCEDRSPEI